MEHFVGIFVVVVVVVINNDSIGVDVVNKVPLTRK